MTRFAFTILLLLSVVGCQTAAQRPKSTFIAHVPQSAKQFWNRTTQFFQPLKPDSIKRNVDSDALFAANRRDPDILPVSNSSHSLFKPGSILPAPILSPQQEQFLSGQSPSEQEEPLLVAETPKSQADDKSLTAKRSPKDEALQDDTKDTAAPLPDDEPLIARAKRPTKGPLTRRDIELTYCEDDFDDEPLRPVLKRTPPSKEEPIIAQSAMSIPAPVYPHLTQLPRTQLPSATPGVVQASYQQSSPPYAHNVSAGHGAGDWQTPARQTIEQLRYAIEQTPNGRTPSNEMRLRMFEMLLDNKAEAAKPMQSADKTVNQFLRHQVLGLATLLDDSIQDNRGRYTSAAYRLNEGLLELQNLCPMKLKTVMFVKDWFGYGQYVTHSGEYRPGENMIVYLELENPTVKKIPDGFEVNAKIDYEIRDVHAKVVFKQSLDAGVDRSFAPKRDFCLGFPGVLPESLTPGQYQLRVSVTDLNDTSMHYAEEQIPLRIVPALAGEEDRVSGTIPR